MNKAKTVSSKKKKFPQISLAFPEKRVIKGYFYQFFLGIIFLGTLFLIFFNLFAAYSQPPLLKALLKNPADSSALKQVLQQNQNPQLDIFLKQELQKAAGANEVKEVVISQKQQLKTISELEELLQQNPQYPDGYAYLAVLYYRQSWCNKAKEAIAQARKLDPNRAVFIKLQDVINRCPF
jgi:tetratricopeptide (TPR) repeat protein